MIIKLLTLATALLPLFLRNLCEPENLIQPLLSSESQLRMGKLRISSGQSIYSSVKLKYELVSKTALDASVAYLSRPQPKISAAQEGLTNLCYGGIIGRTPGQYNW
jgi:hypothetical protein